MKRTCELDLELYSKDFTELGWKSASEVLVPDGRGLTA